MYRTPVKSSRMVSIGWEHNILEIEFPDGVIYQYPNVPIQSIRISSIPNRWAVTYQTVLISYIPESQSTNRMITLTKPH